MKIEIKLPTMTELLEGILEEYRCETVIGAWFTKAEMYNSFKPARIEGYAHFKWVQRDYGSPIEYDSFCMWTLYENGEWMCGDYARFESSNSVEIAEYKKWLDQRSKKYIGAK